MEYPLASVAAARHLVAITSEGNNKLYGKDDGESGRKSVSARKSVIAENFASHSPSMPKGALAYSKKRTDSKNGPFSGRFGRETGHERGEKNTLFCTFSRFGGFLHLQVVAWHPLADSERLQKKSCRKTYGRIYNFWDL